MQNIDLICLGKLNAKYYAEGVAEYTKRLSAFANFKIIELPEEKIEEKNASPALVARALEKEGKAILSSVRKGATLVALCVEGKQISSEELAALLAQKAGSGAGGPGLCDRLLPRAVGGSQAGRRRPDQPGTDHPAPSAGPAGADRAALPGLHHQRRHEVPQIKSTKSAPASLNRTSKNGQ